MVFSKMYLKTALATRSKQAIQQASTLYEKRKMKPMAKKPMMSSMWVETSSVWASFMVLAQINILEQ